jgi:photosystem I P700 chlorophyll a apoprotein A1
MYFHGARFSNYEAWLSDPHIKPSAQVVWPIVGQEILNGDGGGFKVFKLLGSFNYGAQVVLQANFNFTQLRLVV